MLSSLSLRAKLFSLTLLGALGTVIVALSAYGSLGTSISAAEGLRQSAAAQRAQMHADMMHDAIRSDVYSALLAAQTADDRRGTQARTDLDEHSAEFTNGLKEIRESGIDSSVTNRLATLQPALDDYTKRAHAVAEATSGDPVALARAIVAFEEGFRTLEGEMEGLGDAIEARTAAISAASTARFARAKAVIVTVALLAIVVTLVVAGIVERRLSSGLIAVMARVQQLRDACITDLRAGIGAMARGDLTPVIEIRTQQLEVRSTDEIGTLTRTVNDIIDQTQRTVLGFEEARVRIRALIAESNRLVQEARAGRLSQRGDAQAFEGSYRELVEGINQTLDAVLAPISAASETLERLAERDLTARVPGQYSGDHARIQLSVNSAVDKLATALNAVADTADGVASSATQIDAGSKELARGASDQAASLEEVSASARELAAMTRRNAASAAEGRSLSDGALASTSLGVAEVRQLADAIARIKTSAESTARIVKTIDDIAFQTNLLALNAAVEAARAGDSGRGFAVVADEVRSLAMRSADAARSTAELIEESVRSTEQGVALNAKVLTQLSDIDDRVNRVGQVVGEIAAASDEQARGVELIDRALEEMSLRTQAVAANADESEGASRSLIEQSQALRALVGEFRLARTVGATGGLARPAGAASTREAADARRGAAPPSAARPKPGASSPPAAEAAQGSAGTGSSPAGAAPSKASSASTASSNSPVRAAAANAASGRAVSKGATTTPTAKASGTKAGANASTPSTAGKGAGSTGGAMARRAPSAGAASRSASAPPARPSAPASLPEISIPLDDDDWNTVQNF